MGGLFQQYVDLPTLHIKNLYTTDSLPQSIKIDLIARHSKGIYVGFSISSDSLSRAHCKLLCKFPDFDLSTGEWYTQEESNECIDRICDDTVTNKPLRTGKRPINMNSYTNSYGLADNITQILKLYKKVIMRSDYNIILHVTHHNKDDLRGNRWHKMGKYIGNINPEHEYIGDDDVDSLISFNFHIIE